MSDLRNDYLAAYRRSVQSPTGVREANLQAVLERAAAIDDEPAPARWAASALVLKLTTVVVLGSGLGWGLPSWIEITRP